MADRQALRRKWRIMLYLLPIILAICLLKFALNYLGWEVISLNALFVSIVAATTFLLGFLINGVISDYKESEKLPGELACSLEAIYEEVATMHRHDGNADTEKFLVYFSDLLVSIECWFHKKERTRVLMTKLTEMSEHFYRLSPMMPANFIVRLKQEQTNVRKLITRIHTIRETSFTQSGYAIAEALAVLLIAGLLLLQMDPVYEAMFICGLVSFLVLYMILLIKELDNPFDYAQNQESGNNIPLKPLHDLMERVGVATLEQRTASQDPADD
jgi:predicted membrane chloride channel (bestrophin family)